jgi:ParB family chromosome partitioning protein
MVSDHDGADAETVRRIPLADIDRGDERFRVTTRPDSAELAASIDRIGLLAAPLVAPEGAGFVVVSGFRRVSACAGLGWPAIPVRLARPDASPYECALRAVGENSLQRPLNLIETSRALDLLERHAAGGRVPPEDAAALGLPSHPDLMSRLKPLCRLPDAIQAAVLDGTLCLAMAGDLGCMDAGLGADFARLFLKIKPSLNKQRDIVTLVLEIADREGTDPRQVLQAACAATAEGEDPDRNRQTQCLRRRLRERRFPALASAEKNFLALRQRLRLGAAVRLTPPRDFEGTHFALTLDFQTVEEVVCLRDQLSRLVADPDFTTLLTGKATGFGGVPGA